MGLYLALEIRTSLVHVPIEELFQVISAECLIWLADASVPLTEAAEGHTFFKHDRLFDQVLM